MPSQSPIKLKAKDALALAAPLSLLTFPYMSGTTRCEGKFDKPKSKHGNLLITQSAPEIRFRGRSFRLYAVHVHTPAEHVLADLRGATADEFPGEEPGPTEVHFVHIPVGGEVNVDPQVVFEHDPKVVIGIVYQSHNSGQNQPPNTPHRSRASRALSSLARAMKLSRSNKASTPSSPSSLVPIDPSEFFPDEDPADAEGVPAWFHYEGSLTSYPYSADVHWFVMRDVSTVDAEAQEDMLKAIDQHPLPLQPLDRRLVTRSFQIESDRSTPCPPPATNS